jgi:hypothetical protein
MSSLSKQEQPMANQQQLFAKPKPNRKYYNTLQYMSPYMNQAVKVAEGNPNNFGVLSQQVNSPAEANQALNKSIANNFWRWIQTSDNGELPKEKFVDFMQQRWAPLGAANDPNNLNVNWAPNVRKSLQNQLGPEEYKRWRALKLAQNNQAPWEGSVTV